MTAFLTPDESRALDILANLPAPPPFAVDELGRVDEPASDVPRRLALAEIADLKHRARCLSSAVADVVEATARGRTIAPYTVRELRVVADALDAAGLEHMVTEVIKTRLRAVEIQTLLRDERAAHEAAA